MEMRWLIASIFMCIFSLCVGRELNVRSKYDLPNYNHTLATILVEYASAVYVADSTKLSTWTCDRCNGLTKGFQMVQLIVDVEACLQAFVGVAKDPNAIIIAFRGTQSSSIRNWIENLNLLELDFNYTGASSNAMVHHGFYSAYYNTTVRPGIISAVKNATELHGDLQIMVTGHSMGGALAAFCSLDLRVNLGYNNVQVMTFGQPRIGNAAFASYYSKHVPNTIRVTNEHDIVPHLPPYLSQLPGETYHHFPREVWLHNLTSGTSVHQVETACDASGEDPNCSRSVWGNSISDHFTYYGVELRREGEATCKLMMHPALAPYSMTDENGNFTVQGSSNVYSVKQ